VKPVLGLFYHILRRAPSGDASCGKTGGSILLSGENKEKWESLCRQAAVEQDSAELLKLVKEITQMLDEKEQRLKREKSAGRD
jgi:hypothetical protein